MSEICAPQTPTPNLVHDPVQAVHEAYAWKPYMELRAQAEQAGLLDAVEDLGRLATKAADATGVEYLVRQSATETIDSQEGNDEATPTPEQQRTPLTKERISEIASDSVISANTWMYGDEIPRGNYSGVQRGYMQVYNKGSAGEWATRQRTESHSTFRDYGEEKKYRAFIDRFKEAGVSEIITVQMAPERIKFKQIDPSSPKAEEGVVAIRYVTVSETRTDNRRFDYACPDGRSGNSLDILIYLPRSDAEELLAAIQDGPDVIRQVVDAMVREQVGAEKSWDQAKPPYEKWQEANGGVSRIALRTSPEQGIEQSQILEFKTAA